SARRWVNRYPKTSSCPPSSFRQLPLRHQLLPLHLRSGQIAFLDVAETLDLLGNARNLDCLRVIGRAERGDDLLEAAAVLRRKGSLGAALRRGAKDIERRAAQALEPCQDAERRQHGRTVFLLL